MVITIYLFPSDRPCSLKQHTKIEVDIIQNFCNLKFNLCKMIYTMKIKNIYHHLQFTNH